MQRIVDRLVMSRLADGLAALGFHVRKRQITILGIIPNDVQATSEYQ